MNRLALPFQLTQTLLRSKCKQLIVTSTRTIKSDISLDKIYPNSSLKITTPGPVSRNFRSSFSSFNHIEIKITATFYLQPPQGNKFNGYIPLNELDITYSRSSGPGGQNVNVVNTKVDVRFKLDSATFITDEVKKKIREEVSNVDIFH